MSVKQRTEPGTDARVFRYLALLSASVAAISIALAVLYLYARISGFDEVDWLGDDRWYLFGLFAWSLLTIALIGLAELASREHNRLASNAARLRLEQAASRENLRRKNDRKTDGQRGVSAGILE